jgi:hypothetical protein
MKILLFKTQSLCFYSTVVVVHNHINYMQVCSVSYFDKAFSIVAVFSVIAKILIALTCHRFDMESWDLVSNLYLSGLNVYENTLRYNYGPIWFLLLGALRKIHFFYHFPTGPEGYHSIIALFLAIFDVGIAVIIKKLVSRKISFFFLMNPVSLFVSGFLVQFDQIAIFFALLALYFFYKRENGTLKFSIFPYLLMGLSLSIKHIFLFFPIWLMFHEIQQQTKFRWRTLLFLAVPYAIFLLAPLYWLQTEAAQIGFQKAIVHFSSNYLNAPIPKILSGIGVLPYIEVVSLFSDSLKGYKLFWILALFYLGWHFRKRTLLEKFTLYGLAFLALSPSIWSQYYVICLVYVLVNIRSLFAKLFLTAATVFHLMFFLNVFAFKHKVFFISAWTNFAIENFYFPYVPVFFTIPLLLKEYFYEFRPNSVGPNPIKN